jgi:hypothetical protein
MIAILISCGSAKLKGTPVGNQLPSISWNNVPLPDSVFRSNAVVSWFGKDEDGEVINYYYYVVLEDSISGVPDSSYVSQLPEISFWHQTDSTVVTVQLYAPDNEQDTLPQYVFVKCVDNDGAYSNTIFRRFSRINHLPVTLIGDCPGSTTDSMSLGRVVWSLPETTSLWKGLKFSWAGKDTIDYPNDQPDFEYEIKIYGPYDTTRAYANTLQLSDTTFAMMGYWSYDSTRATHWVRNKQLSIKGMPTGVYIFVVRVRDDALAADPTAAWRKFMCIEPVWISDPDEARDVLLSQATQFYPTTPNLGYPLRNTPPNFPDSLIAFYTQMVESTGRTISVFDTARAREALAPAPPMALLAKHRMLIVDNMDFHKPDLYGEGTVDTSMGKVIRDYLAIGGKVWVIGRQAFCGSPRLTTPGREDFSAQSVAYQMFNLSGATNQGMPTDPQLARVAEFRTAKSIDPAFENLQVDSLRCSFLRQVGIGKVEVLERYSNYSQSLFTFGAVNPDTSMFNDLPIAVVYTFPGGLYKTSYFSFPLYLMDNSEDQVQHVFDVMLAWFLTDESL